jgi:hypothetical protein
MILARTNSDEIIFGNVQTAGALVCTLIVGLSGYLFPGIREVETLMPDQVESGKSEAADRESAHSEGLDPL